MDLTPYFAEYEQLVAEVDAVFAKVSGDWTDCVTCKQGCSDCCHAVFDLSLIESVYVNSKFAQHFPFGPVRSQVMQMAAETDRDLVLLKKRYFKAMKDTRGELEALDKAVEGVMDDAARVRIRCPLLLPNESCGLYAYRPITCRLYGIPTAFGGKGHVCGQSGFEPGKGYPTVHLDKIQDRLDKLSFELQQGVGSRYKELHKVYVPLSMALMTKYDDVYMGIGPAPEAR